MVELPIILNFPIQRSSDDNNTSLHSKVDNFSKTEIICIQIVFVILCFLGTTGNIFTIVAFLRSDELRIQTATKLVISLAVSDLLYCLIYMPVTIAIYNDSKIIDSVCPFYLFLSLWFGNVSLITLMAISINRYVMICYNHLYQRIFTTSNTVMMISIIWIFEAGMLLLPLTGIWGKFGKNEEGRCDMIELKATFDTTQKKCVTYWPCIYKIENFFA